MPKSAGYVDPETLQRVAEQLQPLKQRLYDLLQLGPGAHVLSVGCGPGIDTLPLAQRVGPGGKVVGIDIDEEMISLATAKAQAAGVDAGVSHHVADLLDLPFDPYTFHACLADRVLQVLPTSVDPQHALSAMYQVTRPGGGWRSPTLIGAVHQLTAMTLTWSDGSCAFSRTTCAPMGMPVGSSIACFVVKDLST